MALTLAEHEGWSLPTRQDVLDRMLSRYVEAQETQNSGKAHGFSGDTGVLLMPTVWNPSYRKLERLLERMRRDMKSTYWHLGTFYLWKMTRLSWGCRGCGAVYVEGASTWHRHRGQQFKADQRIAVYIRDRGWHPVRVRDGLEWLDVEWDRMGALVYRDDELRLRTSPREPMLPREMLEEQGSKDEIAA